MNRGFANIILKNIHIENYRFYKDFACEFAGNTNLVIGDNGAGKTSLLAAIAQLLSVQISRLGGGFNWKPTDPHTETQKAGDTTLSVRECFPVRISGNLAINSSADINFEIVSIDPTSIEHKGQTDAILKLTEQNESIWPLFSYQRFDRNWKIDKKSAKTLFIETGLNERRDWYKACLTGTGIDDSIQNWCLKMSILEYERHRAVLEFERFKHIIKSFLQAIEDSDDDFEVSYSMEVSGLVMKKAAEIYPLYELSTGYKALLSMIMELAYRSVLLNPSLDTENPGQTGIVIIDEIDAHLHPKWQWRIIDALTKCFPNIQFIIATHSPIVIASAKNARLIDLG